MLTNAQLATLKQAIAADPALAEQPNNSDGAFAIAAAMNLQATPDFTVWKTNISTYDIRSVVVWAEYDALSTSKQNAFQFLCSNGIVNAGLANVRQGITSIFAGPSQSGNLAAMIAVAKRLATRAEKLFASGTGSNATPATMSFEGQLSYQDVEAARNLA